VVCAAAVRLAGVMMMCGIIYTVWEEEEEEDDDD
jgi:hypothetical protein